MDRRSALRLVAKGGISLGVIAGAGLYGRYAFLPPRRSDSLDTVDDLSVRLFDSLSPSMRDQACVDYEHPLRQYHNRGVSSGGVTIDRGNFSREQRALLTDLLYAGLSEQGQDRLPNQFFINWPGVYLLKLLICGDPTTSHYQIILSGPHLNLRLGGRSREGVAFGGPNIYGDQRGDSRQGLPRNVYRYQFRTAHRLFQELEPDQQQAALLPRAPIQTQVELQGRGGSFPGVEIGSLSPGSRAVARELVDEILSNYSPEDVAYAMRCLEENGGIDGLSLSYYEDGEVNGSGEYQIFRLEGPAAVFYFRGYPHVHAFINVGMEGDRPLSVGEILGQNPAVLQKEGVRTLFEDAMRGQAGTDLAFYPDESVVGRLRTGTIRSGDIYCLESWQDSVATTTVRGGAIVGELAERLRGAGTEPAPDRTYTLATTGHVANERASERLGRTGPWQSGERLRDLTIAHLKTHGFDQAV
jgi:Protein of unknown function (DUF3500)